MSVSAELRWEGKYDVHGTRVVPLRARLPFQTVETINEATPERRTLYRATREDQPWRNRLIWGDKKYVLPALLEELAGKVDLIYADPPFDTGADFSYNASVPEPDDGEGDSLAFTKQPSIIEQKAYRDTWGRGLDSYLQWFYETVLLLHELLSERGSIYVHLDPKAVHYAAAIMDEVFGKDCHLNDLIWKRTSARNDADRWGAIHDVILVYTKSKRYTWNRCFQPYDAQYLADKYRYSDTRGKYRLGDLTAAGLRQGHSGKPWKGFNPADTGRHWNINREALESIVAPEQAPALTSQQKLDLLEQHGYIVWSEGRGGGTGIPQYKRYIGKGVAIQDVVTDIPPVNSQAVERLDYPTQKPEPLLERIITASSNEGDLVLDCFVGSGTTAATCEKTNRRWIACDLGRFAIHTTRKRLLNITNVRPFVVQNLGRYERQLWQAGAFPENAEQALPRQRAYIAFMLKLYNAQPITGQTYLHGIKGSRMIHVGGVDGPVSEGDIRVIVAEFQRMTGGGEHAPRLNGIDVLGWDFAFELNEVARQQAERANLSLRFLRIPREVMDKRAVEQGDIHFFELGALSLNDRVEGGKVTLQLREFIIPPDDVPEDVRAAVRHWSQWIDYWAVDWEYDGRTFHNQWQSFRTRHQPKLTLTASHVYAEPGRYQIIVKVIDILGNDTTKSLTVDVAGE